MKLIIAGGRDYRLMPDDWEYLDSLDDVTEVVTGGASGADLGGKLWAISRGIPFKLFFPEWEKHGKAAGPIRNREMASYADAVVLFPGGKGTDDMLRAARAQGIRIYDRRTS